MNTGKLFFAPVFARYCTHEKSYISSILCSAAGKYNGEIDIIYQEKRYTLKSIMILMSLGIPQGGEITIEAQGEGEQDILDTLTGILEEHRLV